MYNYSSKHFIFRQADGKAWCLYFDEKSGICHSTMSKHGNWSEPVSLQKKVLKNFDAEMDENGGIHLAYQDLEGDINYAFLDNSGFKALPVLKSKTSSPYNKYIKLFPYKSKVIFLFVIKHDGNSMLAHQELIDGKLLQPKVVDYVSASRIPYTALCDRSGNLYAFYQSSDSRFLQLGYKKYSHLQKQWSEFIPVTKQEGDCELPSAVIDSKGVVHMCCQVGVDKKYMLIYQQKVPDKNLWSKESLIHTSEYEFDNTSVVCANNLVIVYWVRDDIIYYRQSDDSGITWSKAARYPFNAGRQLVCAAYRSNNAVEMGSFCATDLPVSYIGGLKIAFYDTNIRGIEGTSTEGLKNMIVDSLNMLKSNIDELQESGAKTSQALINLNSGQQSLEREISKLEVRLSLAENHTAQLKTYYRQLELLTQRMDQHEAMLAQSGITAESAGRLPENTTSYEGVALELKKIKKEMAVLKRKLSENTANTHSQDTDAYGNSVGKEKE